MQARVPNSFVPSGGAIGPGHGGDSLAACCTLTAERPFFHLFGDPRTCCGHLSSGTGSRFVREMSEEQRERELAAAHQHMRLRPLNRAESAARSRQLRTQIGGDERCRVTN